MALSRTVKPTGPDLPLRFRERDLPVLCPVRRLTGHRCPGCGMTRAMVYAFRLELGNATAANPMALPALALMLVAAWGGPRRRPLRSPA